MIRGIIYDNPIERQEKRGNRVIINIADLHFGSIDPKVTYQILKEQFIDSIKSLPKLDIGVYASELENTPEYMEDSNNDMCAEWSYLADLTVQICVFATNVLF